MSVIPQTVELYLWGSDKDGSDKCIGRIVGWSRWVSDFDHTDKYSPIVAVGPYGDGAHAKVIDTEGGDYWTNVNHQGIGDEEAA